MESLNCWSALVFDGMANANQQLKSLRAVCIVIYLG